MKDKTYEYLIKLIKSAILGEKAMLFGEDVSIKQVYYLAKNHNICGTIYPAVRQNEELAAGGFGQVLKKDYMVDVAKDMTQIAETKTIIDAFEKKGIKHIPLKGYVLRHFYPSTEMRPSTDFDVYVPASQNHDAYETMMELGYSCEKENIGFGMHDEYRKGVLMNVEVHKDLMSPDFPRWQKICKRIVDNATLCQGSGYRYEFSKEDYYIYMQLHAIKHLKHSSCGIKSIIDIWVYLSKYQDELDWDYINKVLKKGGLTDIDKNLRAVSDWWFNDIEPKNPVIYALSEYIIDSGAFGTHEQYLSGRKADKKKLARLCRAFFLPWDEMVLKYPILKKAPVLLPAVHIYRIFRTIFCKRENATELLNQGNEVSDSMVKSLDEFKRRIGL